MAATYQVANSFHTPDVFLDRLGHVHDCALAIWNGGSCVVDILDIWSDWMSACDVTRTIGGSGMQQQSPLQLERCSAVSGGTDLAPLKFDTADSNLPAQVLIRSRPTSVTSAGVLRSVCDNVGYPTTQTSSSTAWLGCTNITDPGSGAGRLDSPAWDAGHGSSGSVQRLKLIEGEGCVLRSPVPELAYRYGVITIREATSGACYQIGPTDAFSQIGDNPYCLAIFNGSGSGVVLEIEVMKINDVGHAAPGITGYRIFKFEQAPVSGTSLTAVQRDTTSDALPAGLALYQDAVVEVVLGERAILAGLMGIASSPPNETPANSSGAISINHQVVLQIPISLVGCIRSASISRGMREITGQVGHRFAWRDRASENPLRLRPGEGIGLSYGYSSPYAGWDGTNVAYWTTGNQFAGQSGQMNNSAFSPNAVLQPVQWHVAFSVEPVSAGGVTIVRRGATIMKM